MSKKQIYLTLLLAGLIVIGTGYLMHITAITSAVNQIKPLITTPAILGSAALCAFIFTETSQYWLINLGCAIITAVAIQFIEVGHLTGMYILIYRASAFLLVVYFLNLLKIIINK